MDSPLLIKQAISSICSLCNDSIFSEAIEDLSSLKENFKLQYFIFNSHDFKPELVEILFDRLIPLLKFQNQSFKELLIKTLKNWFATCISYCPKYLLELIPKLLHSVQTPVVTPLLLEAFSNLFITLPLQEQLNRLDSLKKLVFACPPQNLVNLDEKIWKIFLNYLDENEIVDLILISVTGDSIKPALILIQKNPEAIMPILSLSAPFNFLFHFLKKVKINFDILPLLAKIGDTIMFEESEDIKYVLKTFNLLMDMVDENNSGAIRSIVKNLIKRMDRDDDVSNKFKHYIFEILVRAELKNLDVIHYDNVKKYFDYDNPEYQRAILYSLIEHARIDQTDEISSDVYKILFAINSKRCYKPFCYLLELLSNKEQSDILKGINNEKFQELYTHIFHPLPQECNLKMLLLKLLDFSLDRNTLEKHLYEFAAVDPKIDYNEESDDFIKTKDYFLSLKKLINNFHISLDISRLDWFSPNAFFNFLLFDKIEAAFVLEILSSNIIDKRFLHYPIDCLCTDPEIAGPLSFNQVFTVLKGFADALGYGPQIKLEKLNICIDFPNWISQEDILYLYNSISKSVTNSPFGRILTSLIRCLLKLKDYVTLNESQLIGITLTCRYVSNSAPSECAKFLSSLFLDVKNGKIQISDEKKTLFEYHVMKYFEEQFSMLGSPDIVNAAIACVGEEELLNPIRPVVIDAISKDIDLAIKLHPKISSDIPKVPTFLYFSDEKFKEWRVQCLNQFVFNSWLIREDDIYLIKELPGADYEKLINTCLLDFTHLNIYYKLKGIENDSFHHAIEPPGKDLFSFNPNIIIEEGPLIHKYERPTKFGVISYLWHSRYKLPDSVDFNLEEYALSKSDDIRMTVGFLTYSQTHKLKINLPRWLNKVVIHQNDELSIFAGSILLCFAINKEELSQEVIDQVNEFINKSLDELGLYDHTNQGILRYYETETGMKWQFVRAVIAVNQKELEKIGPIVVYSEFLDISEHNKIVASAVELITESECKSSYSLFVQAMSTAFLFIRDQMKCNYLLPTNFLVNQRLMSFIEPTQLQNPLFLGSGVIDTIVSVLRKHDNHSFLPFSFLTLLLNLACSDEQYSTFVSMISKFFGKCADYSRFILVHVNEYADPDEEMINLLKYKPPSYLRGFFRAASKKKKANIQVTMKYPIQNIYNHLTNITVFPDLCYNGMGKILMKPWIPQATSLTKLRLGLTDLQTIMGAFTEINPQNLESPYIFYPVSTLEDSDFDETHAWPSALSAKRDFAKVLLETAADPCATVDFAEQVFHIISRNSSISDMADIILNKEYMNKGKFSSVIHIFRKLESLLVAASMEELVHKCMDYHNPKKNMFEDEERAKAFLNPNDEESISISLHYMNTKDDTNATTENNEIEKGDSSENEDSEPPQTIQGEIELTAEE